MQSVALRIFNIAAMTWVTPASPDLTRQGPAAAMGHAAAIVLQPGSGSSMLVWGGTSVTSTSTHTSYDGVRDERLHSCVL
jgi:hypothetical protein